MRMITHSYDTYDEAVRVVSSLEASGIPHDDISIVSGDKDRTVATDVVEDTAAAGTGATIGTVLGGGAGLLAGLGALAIPGVGPVVAAGWLIATLTGAGVGAAAGGLVGSLANSGVDDADASRYAEHVGRGGTLVTVRASDDQATDAEYIMEHGTPRGESTLAADAALGTGMTTAASTPVSPVVAPVAVPMGTGTVAATGDDKLQVVKENLVVGKREVEAGGVTITSHVVETPVQEQVSLREERVTVDRRPVNRPLSGVAADAFRDRVLTARAVSEEAVVGKDVRVVEEIGLHKDASERVQTISDTVRETKVDVQQTAGTATGTVGTGSTVTGGTTGTVGTSTTGNTLRDNPVTRTVDRTLDTNTSGENPKI